MLLSCSETHLLIALEETNECVWAVFTTVNCSHSIGHNWSATANSLPEGGKTRCWHTGVEADGWRQQLHLVDCRVWLSDIPCELKASSIRRSADLSVETLTLDKSGCALYPCDCAAGFSVSVHRMCCSSVARAIWCALSALLLTFPQVLPHIYIDTDVVLTNAFGPLFSSFSKPRPYPLFLHFK